MTHNINITTLNSLHVHTSLVEIWLTETGVYECVLFFCFYPESVLIVVLMGWTGGRRCGRFTSRRWGRIVGHRVPTHPQLGLVNGGQLTLLAHAWLAPGSKRSFHWLLAAGKPRVRVDHLLHLCRDNKRWWWLVNEGKQLDIDHLMGMFLSTGCN